MPFLGRFRRPRPPTAPLPSSTAPPESVTWPPVSWDEANLPIDRAAALIALAGGLVAIGHLRRGENAGQISIHNFLLRAAEEPRDSAPVLVVLMRAGVFRRHTWFLRVFPAADGSPTRLELPSPIDADWDWWPAFEEVRDRLVQQGVWAQAVSQSFDDRQRDVRTALTSATLVKSDLFR